MHMGFMDGGAYAVEYKHGIALIEYADITQKTQPSLSLLRWLGSLEFLGTTELLGTVLALLPQFTRRLVFFGQ